MSADTSHAQQKTRQPTIVVIGAGMTGLCLAIKFQEAGINDVILLEKTDQLGGTWRENTYPGVACDIPAHMYTYSFEPNPEWSHRFAHGEEIQAYFERVGRKYGISSKIRFNEAVTSSVYENDKWTVTTSRGDTIVADFVINSTGILHHPAMPDIEGIESFKKPIFHTARWDHSVDLAGKKVGIIGTGSTAAQVIPEVSAQASLLTVFQRTPQWVLPIPNKPTSEKTKRRQRKRPYLVQIKRAWYNWALAQILTKAVTGHKVQNFFFSNLCKLYMRRAIKDPVMREKLTPDYKVGCKRIVISSTIIPAMQKQNVELITDGIERITEAGVVTESGQHIELDVLILSTGFQPTAYMRPMELIGRNGMHINDAWKHKLRLYRSMFMRNFPNNFLMLGPNSPIGNYSVIEMSEIQSRYLLKLIDRWRNREFDTIEVKEEAVTRFNAYIKKGLSKTVWVGGCNSWYLDADGDPILWPYTFGQWEKEMEEPDMNDFIFDLTDSSNSKKKAA